MKTTKLLSRVFTTRLLISLFFLDEFFFISLNNGSLFWTQFRLVSMLIDPVAVLGSDCINIWESSAAHKHC